MSLHSVDNQVSTRPTARPADTRSVRWRTPAVDVYERDDGWLLAADLPGVTQDRLEVRLEAGKLRVDTLQVTRLGRTIILHPGFVIRSGKETSIPLSGENS